MHVEVRAMRDGSEVIDILGEDLLYGKIIVLQLLKVF